MIRTFRCLALHWASSSLPNACQIQIFLSAAPIRRPFVNTQPIAALCGLGGEVKCNSGSAIRLIWPFSGRFHVSIFSKLTYSTESNSCQRENHLFLVWLPLVIGKNSKYPTVASKVFRTSGAAVETQHHSIEIEMWKLLSQVYTTHKRHSAPLISAERHRCFDGVIYEIMWRFRLQVVQLLICISQRRRVNNILIARNPVLAGFGFMQFCCFCLLHQNKSNCLVHRNDMFSWTFPSTGTPFRNWN